jgi:hypothetical protein
MIRKQRSSPTKEIMIFRRLTLGMLLLGLASCGGEESSTTPAVFTDASSAVDAGNEAIAAGNYEAAAHAYRYVVDNPPTDQALVDYTMDLCKALVGAGKETDAMEALTALATEHSELLTAEKLQGLADSCLKPGKASSARMAEHVLNIAKETLAETELAKFDTNRVEQGMKALQSGDTAKLAELGYVGD